MAYSCVKIDQKTFLVAFDNLVNYIYLSLDL